MRRFNGKPCQQSKMAPTDEFSTDFKKVFDFDLDTPYILIGGGPHQNLKTHPSTPYP